MIERRITPHLLEMARYFPVVTIMGPRQSGKTTLAKKIFPNHVYVNLEDKTAREIAMSDPKATRNGESIIRRNTGLKRKRLLHFDRFSSAEFTCADFAVSCRTYRNIAVASSLDRGTLQCGNFLVAR